MPDTLPPDDLQQMWQTQPVEVTTMSIDEIRRKAGRFEHRIWWRNAREYAAMVLVMVCFGYYLYKFPHPAERAGSMLVIAGTLYIGWQLHKRASVRSAPVETGFTTCLEFHVRELERQRDALNSLWRWYLGPMIPGLVVFVAALTVSGRAPERQQPALIALWLAIFAASFWGVWKMNQRAARKLQRRIDELNAMGRQVS